ncbi:unnamed protein product [Urochloa humidicola]
MAIGFASLWLFIGLHDRYVSQVQGLIRCAQMKGQLKRANTRETHPRTQNAPALIYRYFLDDEFMNLMHTTALLCESSTTTGGAACCYASPACSLVMQQQ